MADRRLWTFDEDNIIKNLVTSHGLKKWTTIAHEMKKHFPQLARTSKQIRQRWYNHLNPEVNKKPWTAEEEQILFQAHKKYGNKWKQIAKLLQSRTDNSAKNHFYSTLRRSLRRINKFLGFKNSTNQMKELKPSILSTLVESVDFSEESRMLVNGIFHFASIKPSKSKTTNLETVSEKQKQFFREALSKIVVFNQKYGENRQFLKKKSHKKILHFVRNSSKKKLSRHKNSSQKEEEIPTPSSHKEVQESYEISILSKSQWEDSAQNGCRMLPELQKPQGEDLMYLQQNQQQYIHYEIQTQKIFEEIEISFINN